MISHQVQDESVVGEQWSVSAISPYEKNAKIHDNKQIKELAASIEEFGWRSRILVDSEGVIIAGHGRLEAAKYLELETVPVTVAADLSPAQINALRLADNKVSSVKYDTNMLMEELEALHVGEEFDMSSWFDEKELEFATVDLGEIDLDALVDNIQIDVEEQSESTQRELESEFENEYQIGKVLGFGKVNADQRRSINRLMFHIESSTGLKGAEALAAHALDYVSEAGEVNLV